MTRAEQLMESFGWLFALGSLVLGLWVLSELGNAVHEWSHTAIKTVPVGQFIDSAPSGDNYRITTTEGEFSVLTLPMILNDDGLVLEERSLGRWYLCTEKLNQCVLVLN